jgi:hypothetical protein
MTDRQAPPSVPARWVRVLLEKREQASEWQPYRWELADVSWCPDLPPEQDAPVFEGGDHQAGCYFRVTLYADEADGYYLNCTSDYPAWFVHWRLNEEYPDEPPRVNFVTLSYNEAGRILDAGETVENLPVDVQTAAWLAAFAQEHFVPEPRKRQRPESFKRVKERFEAGNG